MIRPATPGDAAAAIRLLFLAMEEIALKLTGLNDPQLALPIFEALFRQTGNQYSYENALLYEDESGVGGLIIAYDGGKLDQLRKPVLDYIEQQRGHRFQPEDETGPGEYYLDSIAVSPASQGKGIGRQLILAAMEKGKREGLGFAGLLVHAENLNAQQVYERLGFGVVKTVEFSGGFYYHLQKVL
ncbi:GNAT family N-acetyltransferase [Chitinophaga sp. GCM10012297]|uniref:GNAT family N-acetyltransferase n=1 Tax=Chitinophaga chungangae TaxID=2821488 RepID=A0ABS3YH83_9BACT|nr:N-acetyltransferase [Chitinophaga chungangae]MBO9154063.1 GNAT family N-acetyltransferase [Chitinophaga chungangae]